MTFLKLRRKGAVKHWFKMLGNYDSDKAREENPDSIRAACGADDVENAVHGPANIHEVAFFLGQFTDCELRVTGYGLRVAGYGLRIASKNDCASKDDCECISSGIASRQK